MFVSAPAVDGCVPDGADGRYRMGCPPVTAMRAPET